MTNRTLAEACTSLLLAAIACLPLKAQSGLTTEMYDFSTFTVKTLGLYNNNGAQADLTLDKTELFKVDGHSMYIIQDFSNAKGTFKFNGRFAMEHKDAFKLRSGQNESGVNKYVGFQARTSGMHYLSILNLAPGDKFTILCYNHRKLMQFVSDNVKGYPPGSTIVSGPATTYTVTEGGHVDMKIEQYAYIYSIKVETSNPAGSAPSPSFKMTGTDGTKRLITITRGLSAADTDVTTYYTTDGTDPTTKSPHFTGNEHTVTIGQGITRETKIKLRAMSVSGNGRQSPVAISQEYTVGVMLSLTPVAITLTDFTPDTDGIYHPVYAVESDNSLIVGAPKVTLSTTFNGQPVQLTQGKFTATEPGTLYAEVKADGYAATKASTSVKQATWARVSATDFTAMTTANLNRADLTNKSEWQNAIQGKPLYGYQIQHDHDKLAPYMKLSNNNWGLFFSDNALTQCQGIASRWGSGNMQFTLTDNQLVLVRVGLGGVNDKAYNQTLAKGKNFAAEKYVIVRGFEIYEPVAIQTAIQATSTDAPPLSTSYYTISGQAIGHNATGDIRIVTTTLADGRKVSKKVLLK